MTETCDVSEAVAVDSGYPDIKRFEDIESQQAEIELVIVPTGEQPLGTAQQLVEELDGVQIDDRPVTYVVDSAIDDPVSSRSELALSRGAYVWIIDELDVEEGTVQLRSNLATAAGRGLEPDDVLDLIEDAALASSTAGAGSSPSREACITYESTRTGSSLKPSRRMLRTPSASTQPTNCSKWPETPDSTSDEPTWLIRSDTPVRRSPSLLLWIALAGPEPIR